MIQSPRSLCFLLIIFSLAGLSKLTSAQNPQFSNIDTADVDSIFSGFEPTCPGCAVGVISHGELIFSRGYGSANLDYGIPLRPDSRFMIASISKQFAAAALLLLEQEGKLDLDEDIRSYIPELPEFDYTVTARHVIHHTSGLRDIFSLLNVGDIGLDNTTTPEAALSLIARQQRLNFPPGSEYLYSNSGYFLMSVLVENLSGMSLREYTDQHFFRPIGMTSTHFHDDTGMIVPDRVISYRPTRHGPGQFYRTNMDRVGARGLFTTLEDMALWDHNFVENKSSLKNFTMRMTETGITIAGDTLDYAAGLRVSRYKGLKTVGHGGNYMGFRTNYMRFPEHDLAIAVFCNMSNINPASYSRQVADLYLRESFNEQFDKYPGQYYNQLSGTRHEIILEDGDLYLKKGLNEKERLIWRSDDQFRTGQWNIEFSRNDQDKISSLQIKTSRTGNVTFKKTGNR